MRRHDAQRKADAGERARLKADAKKGKEARIAAMWLCEADMPTIAAACGVSQEHVADVLERNGLREKTKGKARN
jgi:hypothetical protein